MFICYEAEDTFLCKAFIEAKAKCVYFLLNFGCFQIAHDTLLQYGSTDLQALLQITGEGGAWSNPILAALLSGQPTIQQEG